MTDTYLRNYLASPHQSIEPIKFAMKTKKEAITLLLLVLINASYAKDGHKLWLQYLPFDNKSVGDYYRDYPEHITIVGESFTLAVIQKEFEIASEGFFFHENHPVFSKNTRSNLTWILKSDDLPDNIKNKLGPKLWEIKEEGYWLKSYQRKINITAKTDIGLLYGTFAFLNAIQTKEKLEYLDLLENPKI